MNRRTFNATSLAALLTSLPRASLAQQATPEPIGYQFVKINEGALSKEHGGMATQHKAVNDETLFQVASCSKTVTALAILTLVRDGSIDLDQPANRYIKRWQLAGPRGETATIAELMSHTAGTTVHGFNGYGPDDEIPSLEDILSGRHPANSDMVRTRRRLFRKFKYSGGGITVLQMLIEDVTGINFETYTAAKVLKPIGSHRATFMIKPKIQFAHGYHDDGQPLKGGFRRHPESGAAGLWATASDLAKIMLAIVNSLRGVRNAIIPIELAERMLTAVSWRSGLGVFVHPGHVISHSGRNHGFDSIMAAELETGRIRAAVTNRNGAIEDYSRMLVKD